MSGGWALRCRSLQPRRPCGAGQPRSAVPEPPLPSRPPKRVTPLSGTIPPPSARLQPFPAPCCLPRPLVAHPIAPHGRLGRGAAADAQLRGERVSRAGRQRRQWRAAAARLVRLARLGSAACLPMGRGRPFKAHRWPRGCRRLHCWCRCSAPQLTASCCSPSSRRASQMIASLSTPCTACSQLLTPL